MSNVWAKIKHEIHEVIPPTVFFLISFYIIVLNRALMAKEFGLQATSFAAATVGALLVAKVVVIADMLPAVNRFPEKPLIYNVVWKTAIYVGASLLAHYLEHLVPLWWRLGFSAANEQLWSELVWAHFWAIQLWLAVLVFIYCTARELIHVIGRDRFVKIFFGAPASRPI
ncbi:MAG: hypothetical protein DMD87_02055 [Candidatus Rokuibacteriota bacterium]|nr:MAG: hypothetical protein DMD87_02055 [Candidatus Rokubacteria bacterium]